MINLTVFSNPVVRYASVFLAGAFVTFLVLPSANYSKDEYLKREKDLQTSYEAQLQESTRQLDLYKSSSEEQISKIKTEHSRKESEYTSKINALTSENTSLRTSSTRVSVEIRRPDGTVEKRTTFITKSESESMRITQVQQESEQKIRETTEKLTQEYSLKIQKLESQHESDKQLWSLELTKTREQLKVEQEKHTKLVLNKRNFSLGVGQKLNSTATVLAEYDFYGPIFAGSMFDLKGKTYDTAGLLIGLRF